MKILVVDDDPAQREVLKGFLQKRGFEAKTAAGGREALALFAGEPFQLALLDHKMPDITGDEVLAQMKAINPLIRAIMITAFGTVDTAVRVMKLGADEFIEKPVDLLALLDKIQRIEQRLLVEAEADDVAETVSRTPLPLHIVGAGSAMKSTLSMIRRIAPTPWSVLIRGETGTGKELAARLLHLLSTVADGPFIPVNCGSVPENLFESELFGHEKGAFTGAVSARRGRFEMAAQGTLFLDEIGELPVTLQPKLLRALQEKRIQRVGAEKEIPVDVRVVAATNRDLKELAARGRFREDLFYRLNVFDIEIPPLRARKEDIPLLVDHFTGRYGRHPVRFDPDAMSTLMKYTFPGNVRELEHIVQRAVTLARTGVIQERDLPSEIRFHQVKEGGSLSERLDSVEREMIISALEQHDGVQTRAAEVLGIGERVLRYKMKKHGIKNHS